MARTKKWGYAIHIEYNTRPDIGTGEIWQNKMPVRGAFLRPPHGTNKSVVNENINWNDMYTQKNNNK